ncbi:hypothetical protein JT26_09765 [Porphyromonas sp. COT-108 OH1349]|nr:hypothetical protein JT26_09765 [Porphyromonas sp. COT-108 OH1349]
MRRKFNEKAPKVSDKTFGAFRVVLLGSCDERRAVQERGRSGSGAGGVALYDSQTDLFEPDKESVGHQVLERNGVNTRCGERFLQINRRAREVEVITAFGDPGVCFPKADLHGLGLIPTSVGLGNDAQHEVVVRVSFGVSDVDMDVVQLRGVFDAERVEELFLGTPSLFGDLVEERVVVPAPA